jgi:predicted transcriptional regulator
VTHSRAPLTAEQIAARWAAIHAGRKAGQTWNAIAADLGLTYDGLRRWVETISHRKPTTQRECKCCLQPFASEGIHHRMCGACRTRDVSPYTPDPGGDTGRRVGRAR